MHKRTLAAVAACSIVFGLAGCAGLAPPPPPPPPPPPAPPEPNLEVEFGDGHNWAAFSPLYWEIGESGVFVEVPTGFVHDKASIPPALHSLIQKEGKYTRAAVVHDYLYWSQRCTRRQADNLLMIAMKESDVGLVDRTAVYNGVRAGGGAAWSQNAAARARGELRFTTRMPKGNQTWPELRAELVNEGVKNPDVDPRDDYCEFGNSTDVPGAPGA